MADGPFYVPNRKPDPPAQPGEPLFAFVYGLDRYVVELRDHGAFGVEAQFFLNEELFTSRRFDRRALAMQWAEGSEQTHRYSKRSPHAVCRLHASSV